MMKKLYSLIIALTILWLPTPSKAALTYKTSSLPDGANFVIIQGSFEKSDDLSEFSKIATSHSIAFVTFDSPGGQVFKALELGRLIRHLGLDTIQPRATLCASACSLAFLGGVRRSAEAGSIGVHQASVKSAYALDAGEAAEGIQRLTGQIIAYVTEMGADAAFLQIWLSYPSWDMRYLSSGEMTQYRIVTNASARQTMNAPKRRSDELPPEPRSGPDNSLQNPSLPIARTGQVRALAGFIGLREEADESSRTISILDNKSKVIIIKNSDNWYRISYDGLIGYAHHNWILVDQFVNVDFDSRYIQVASFKNLNEALSFKSRINVPSSIYISTNRAYIVALEDTFDLHLGRKILTNLKLKSNIPIKPILTVGNTYISKLY
ncbi:SH3 domain-containing protein [Bosea sp. NBC_00550]|uniref:SH3 domain-containing protein n=1 Tax=Bosea sp. NBC_00550 TaxID=2969621 RepID=UPI00222FD34E|nr:SH3 domain-containing protein [Bosea sp. NBC_00550]UZF91641.1 SH3 domain-containing protein [Bosea sp. NBC_00550]